MRPHPAIFVPPLRHPGGPWSERRCDQVVTPAVRAALWSFLRGTAHLLHPGAATPDEPARLSGLNDGRGAPVKVGMLGTDTGGVCLVLAARRPGAPPPPGRPWRYGLGAEGVRADAAVISGVEPAAPADVAPLLAEGPSPQARPWLVVRAVVRERAGTLAVDPGDGVLRPVLTFSALRLTRRRPAGERPARCPDCGGTRIRRYSSFDLCPDCAWSAQPR
ncbi:hypothetical protein AB0J80_31080 [Actinoplanes sp. NPDC049548]|uniref:hypothetical protein n=1 Tax=Actinoplanes sp. NPDC049548 TaxID=3155152 RepID=UPI003413ECA4